MNDKHNKLLINNNAYKLIHFSINYRSSFDYEAKTSKKNFDIHPQSTTETQFPNLSNSSIKDIDILVAELEKLKSENSELMSIKYSKNVRILYYFSNICWMFE